MYFKENSFLTTLLIKRFFIYYCREILCLTEYKRFLSQKPTYLFDIYCAILYTILCNILSDSSIIIYIYIYMICFGVIY